VTEDVRRKSAPAARLARCDIIYCSISRLLLLQPPSSAGLNDAAGTPPGAGEARAGIRER